VNPLTHEETTGPEIWEQTAGQIDVFVGGIGTGGTITGVGRYLKKMNPKIQIVAVDPVGSIVQQHFYTGKMGEAESYKTEGIGEDFIPSNYDYSVIDDIVKVSDKETMLMTRRLVREEGIFAGNSSGAALAGALRYIADRDLGPEKMVVVLLPDNGSRYLSKVFDDNWMRENQFLGTDWSDTTVSTVMERKTRKGLITANCKDAVSEVISKMKANDISQLPVLGERDQLLGIVTEVGLLSYLLNNAGQDAAKTPVEDAEIIDTSVPDLRPGTPIETMMSIFSTHDIALVTERMGENNDQRVVGILTKIDLLDFLSNRNS
jgi:cystathionine beta-synthase